MELDQVENWWEVSSSYPRGEKESCVARQICFQWWMELAMYVSQVSL